MDDKNNHTKHYRFVKGHRVGISFSEEKNPELFMRIREILLTCSNPDLDNSNICSENSSNDTITPSDKEEP